MNTEISHTTLRLLFSNCEFSIIKDFYINLWKPVIWDFILSVLFQPSRQCCLSDGAKSRSRKNWKRAIKYYLCNLLIFFSFVIRPQIISSFFIFLKSAFHLHFNHFLDLFSHHPCINWHKVPLQYNKIPKW